MTPMTYSETYEAIIEHLKTFSDLPLENVQVGNTNVDGGAAFEPTGTWAQMRVNYAPTIISGLADNPVTRRVGVLSFRLFGERGYGEYPLLDLAEKLTQHFQFHRVSFLEFLTGDISAVTDMDSKWHKLDVSFTFRVYTNGAKNTPTPPPPPPPPPFEPPVLLSKIVSTSGLSVVLTFDKAITVNNLILDLSVNAANRTYTHTVNGTVLTITPSSVIYQGETVSIAYTSGISDLSGNEADASTANALNNSTVVKPIVTSNPIAEIFSGGKIGMWYDIQDLSTMFQDVAGTIPVTAVGQTVARINSKNGDGKYQSQSVVSRQAILQRNNETGAYYLLTDGIDDNYLANDAYTPSNSIIIGFAFCADLLTAGSASRDLNSRSPTIGYTFASGRITLSSNYTDINATLYIDTSTASIQPPKSIVIFASYGLHSQMYRLNGFQRTASASNFNRYGQLIELAGNSSGVPVAPMKFYGSFSVQKELTATEIQAIESYYASLSGATLR